MAWPQRGSAMRARFPRLYVAASLKPLWSGGRPGEGESFSAALCRGLIEASTARSPPTPPSGRFPRLYVAASLKRALVVTGAEVVQRFPRLYVAASLKHGNVSIEILARIGFPRLYVAASLKQHLAHVLVRLHAVVFRGFMSRPH